VGTRQVLEAGRGKPSDNGNRKDYNFVVDWTPTAASRPGQGHVEPSAERQRGSPLDKLVAELMIVANATWGGCCATPASRRCTAPRRRGKVRMSTVAAAHEGPRRRLLRLVVSSPLRRYVRPGQPVAD
jgi:exoribonuclease-2